VARGAAAAGEPVKIGFDVSQTGALKAGCGYFADSLIQALAALDHENEYTLYPAFGTRFWDPDHAQTTRRISRAGFHRGPEGISHAECIALFRQPPDRLETLLGRPDLVHANNYSCPRLLHSRVVFTLYDLIALDHPEFITEGNRLVCAEGLLDAAVGADMILAISRATRNRFLELFPHYPASRIQVVYPGSRFAEATRGPAPCGLTRDAYWLAVGTLEPRKNLRRVLRAYAALAGDPNDPPLAIAGGQGWMEEDLERFIQGLGLRDRVKILGYVPDEVLAGLYANCLGFLYPSLEEGFGMPVLEAMTLGAPVITSRRPSLAEVAGESALMVDPEDDAELEQAMRRLATDETLRLRLRETGRERARGFSWNVAAQRTLELYADARRRPPLGAEHDARTMADAHDA
jgi:glycosyltransferase involved in cell wall biosynthesis